MDLDENSYVLAFGFVSGEYGNIQTAIVKGDSDNQWIIETRNRTFATISKDPFDGLDRKTFFKKVIEGNEEKALDKFRVEFVVLKNAWKWDFTDFFTVKGDAQKFMNILKDKPYMNVKFAKSH